MQELLVSVSGIRGIVGQSLTPDRAAAFAAALGTHTGGGRIVLCRDSRPSGEMLRPAVLGGLLATGCEVHDIGVAPTPTCGLAVENLQAAGGIQITASHNPAEWNGLKMFGADGAVLSPDAGKVVQEIFTSQTQQYAAWDGLGSLRIPPEVGAQHVQKVCDQVGVAEIQSKRLRVVLDANGGAGGPMGVDLLNALGCDVLEMGCSADGRFEHPPEPIPAHLTDIAPTVARGGAAIGFVLDPDADRLALIDEQSNCLSEELTLALCVRYRLEQQPGPVAINMSTTRAIADLAAAKGCLCTRSAVGEANVVELMRRTSAILGGEGNGGVIDPRIGWVRDPFIGMAMILHLMASTGQSLSQLVAELPHYVMRKVKLEVPQEQLVEVFPKLRQNWPEAEVNDIDGLRLDWTDRWVHLRPSNTEPVVRIIAEASEEAQVDELISQVQACLGSPVT